MSFCFQEEWKNVDLYGTGVGKNWRELDRWDGRRTEMRARKTIFWLREPLGTSKKPGHVEMQKLQGNNKDDPS